MRATHGFLSVSEFCGHQIRGHRAAPSGVAVKYPILLRGGLHSPPLRHIPHYVLLYAISGRTPHPNIQGTQCCNAAQIQLVHRSVLISMRS